MTLAVSGSSSQIWIPGTEVGMARNGPPVLVPGLGSQLSSWLKPPDMLKQRTRICFLANSFAAAGRANTPRPPATAPVAMPPKNDRRASRWSEDPQAYLHFMALNSLGLFRFLRHQPQEP